MADYNPTTGDNGGVHINSGIPNHAFYLAAVAIGGNAWDQAGQIWYKTLTDKLNSQSQFADAAQATVNVAGDLYGVGGAEQLAVCQAWKDVGIQVTCGDEDDTGPGPKPVPWCQRMLNKVMGR